MAAPLSKRSNLASKKVASPVSVAKGEPKAPRVSPSVPTIYADNIIDIVYGIHTSKVVLGVELGNGNFQAIGVVVVPTAALFAAGKSVVQDLSSPAMVKETAERMKGILAMMSGRNPKD